MGSNREENFCLRWNDFESNLSSAFLELRNDADLCDVTLATDEDSVGAHKLVLSACSPQLKEMIRKHIRLSGGNTSQNMMIYLRGVRHADLVSVLEFMYCGSVNVAQEDLNSFLAVAEDLKVKGLTQNSNNKEMAGSKSRPGAAKRSVTPSGGGGGGGTPGGGGSGTPAAKKFRPSAGPSSSNNSQSNNPPSSDNNAKMVKTEPGSNKEDHDALAVEDIEPEQDYGEDSHQGGDDTFDDSYGAGGADDIGFEGDEGGAGPSEIGKGGGRIDKRYSTGIPAMVDDIYFHLIDKDDKSFSASCMTCGKVVQASLKVNSNLVRHLKSSHPEVHALYKSEGYKSGPVCRDNAKNFAKTLAVPKAEN